MTLHRIHSILFRLIFFSTLACITTPALAQRAADGSIYSRFGLGELRSFPSSQIEALGGTGAGLLSLNYANFENPAAWAHQVLTRASAGFSYQNISITDAAENTSRLESGWLNGVQFSFPIKERRLGVAFGFNPFSRVSYRVRQEGMLPPGEVDSDSVRYAVDFQGGGGIQQIVGGLGYRLTDRLSLGANVNVLFGIIENGRRTSFFQGGYDPSNVAEDTRLVGLTARVGGMYAVPRIFGEEDLLSVGAAFTLPTSLSGKRVHVLGETLDRDTLGTEMQGDVDIPWALTGGASYRPDNRWLLTAGVEYQPWSQFESDLVFPGQQSMRDRIHLGAGVEFLPAGSDLLARYLRRVAYRLGFRYDRMYASPSPDISIETLAATGGLSLPTMMSGTRLDINVEVGTRGSTDDGLVRDLYYRLSANVNIGERWFQKSKLR